MDFGRLAFAFVHQWSPRVHIFLDQPECVGSATRSSSNLKSPPLARELGSVLTLLGLMQRRAFTGSGPLVGPFLSESVSSALGSLAHASRMDPAARGPSDPSSPSRRKGGVGELDRIYKLMLERMLPTGIIDAKAVGGNHEAIFYGIRLCRVMHHRHRGRAGRHRSGREERPQRRKRLRLRAPL